MVDHVLYVGYVDYGCTMLRGMNIVEYVNYVMMFTMVSHVSMVDGCNDDWPLWSWEFVSMFDHVDYG